MSLEDLNFKISIASAETTQVLESLSSTLGSAHEQTMQLGKTLGELPNQRLETAEGYLKSISLQAADLKFTMQEVAHSFEAAEMAAHPLTALSPKFGIISNTFVLAATGANLLSASLGTASVLATYLASGLAMVMIPLQGLIIAAKMFGAAFLMAFKAVLIPIRLVIGSLKLLFNAVMAIVSPFITVSHGVFRLKHSLQNLQIQVALLKQFMSMLPPKMRAVFVGLVALGAAGRAGSFAVSLVTKAFNLLNLAMMAVTRPAAAVKLAAKQLGMQMLLLSMATYRAVKSLLAFVASSIAAGLRGIVTSFRSIAASVGSAAASIGSRLISSAMKATVVVGALGVTMAAMGIKSAVAAETSAVVFGTMLKNMDQGRALMAEMEGWRGAPLFDPKAVQDAGRDLLKAGVPVDLITAKMDQLGQIAVATKTPLEDLSRIYRQGMAKGAFQTDLVNQMAERGIDIYHALEKVTGKQGLVLAKMLSDGKIGAEQMNAAIDQLTLGTGIYAGAIENVSNTHGGMFSAMLNASAMASRELGIQILGAFDFKGLMQSRIDSLKNFRATIYEIQPALIATAGVIKAAFGAVAEIVTVSFDLIMASLGVTSENWMTTFLEWAAIASWAFKEWPNIMTLAFTNLMLNLAAANAEYVYFFTGTMPTLLNWFADNWQNVFWNAAKVVGTVFMNINENIRRSMMAIWDFIASGGTQPLTVAWVPLMEGFKHTLAELPAIPPRPISDLERQLKADSENLANALGSSLSAEIDANMQMLDKWKADREAMVVPELQGGAQPDQYGADGTPDAQKGNQKQAENKALSVRSQEGQSFVSQFLRASGTKEEKMISEQKRTNDHLNEIKRDARRRTTLKTRQWRTV